MNLTDKDFKVTIMNMFMDLMNRWESQVTGTIKMNQMEIPGLKII